MAIWTDFMGVLSAPRTLRRPRVAPDPTTRRDYPFGRRVGLGFTEQLGSTLGYYAYGFTPLGPTLAIIQGTEHEFGGFIRTLLPRGEVADPLGVYEFKYHKTELARPDILLKRLGKHQRDKFMIGLGRGLLTARDRREWRDIKQSFVNEGTDIFTLLEDSSAQKAHLMVYEQKLTGTCSKKNMVEMTDEWMLGTYAGKDHLRANTGKDAAGEYKRRGYGRSLHQNVWQQLEEAHAVLFDPASRVGSTQKLASSMPRKSFLKHIRDTAQDLRARAASASPADAASLHRQADALDRSANLVEKKIAREKYIGGTAKGFRGFRDLYSGRIFREVLFRGFVTGGMWRDWKNTGMFAWQRRLGTRLERYATLNLGRRVEPLSQKIRRGVYYGPKKLTGKIGARLMKTGFAKSIVHFYNNLPAPAKVILKGPLKLIKGAVWVAKKAILLAANPLVFTLSLAMDAYDWVKDRIKKALKKKIINKILTTIKTKVFPVVKKVVKDIAKKVLQSVANFLKNIIWKMVQMVVKLAIDVVVKLVAAALTAVGVPTLAVILLIVLIIGVIILLIIFLGSAFFPSDFSGGAIPEDPIPIRVMKTVTPSQFSENLTGGKTAEVTYTVVVKNETSKDLKITRVEDTKYQIQVDNNCSLVGKTVGPGEQTASGACTYVVILQNVADTFVENGVRVDGELGGSPVYGQGSASVKVGAAVAHKPCGWPSNGQLIQLFGVPGYAGGTHLGIDIGAGSLPNQDQPVYSTLDGTIYKASWWSDNCFGNILVKSENNSYAVRFLHLDEATINNWKDKIGTRVSLGEYLGKTKKGYPRNSCTSGAHLHYEVREGITEEVSIRREPQDYTGGAKKGVGDSVSAGGCFSP